MPASSFLQRFTATAVLAIASTCVAQNPPVLTAEYDNARTTANNAEFALNPASVSPSSFGKRTEWQVDGVVAAQPLYVPGLKVGKRTLNVVFVATMNNSVYAFNADAPTQEILWHTNLGPNVPQGYAGACPAYFSTGALGILSTPVIDSNQKNIYVVAANPTPGQNTYSHTLYSLDLATGTIGNKGSALIASSVPGTGTSSVNGTIALGPTTTNLIQRPALLFLNNQIFVGFSGCGPDPSPYHGWVVSFLASNLKLQSTYNATPNGDEGGIWQGGRGLVGDENGSVYFETGNGTYDQGDLGESFVKLSNKGALQDWYTPPDVATLSDLDLDLSTTSPIYTPDTHLLIGGGKQGLIYVLNAASLGHSGPALQTFTAGVPCSLSFSSCQKIHSLAYWQSADGPRLFAWPTGDKLYSYRFTNGQFTTSPESQNQTNADYPGGILTVTSAAGVPATGIVWGITPGVLHAYAATNLGTELWNSTMNAARDGFPGAGFHFGQFTVTAGKAFVPVGSNKIFVYGLL